MSDLLGVIEYALFAIILPEMLTLLIHFLAKRDILSRACEFVWVAIAIGCSSLATNYIIEAHKYYSGASVGWVAAEIGLNDARLPINFLLFLGLAIMPFGILGFVAHILTRSRLCESSSKGR